MEVKYDMDHVVWWLGDEPHNAIIDFSEEGLIGNFEENAVPGDELILLLKYDNSVCSRFGYTLKPINILNYHEHYLMLSLDNFKELEWDYLHNHLQEKNAIVYKNNYAFLMTPVFVSKIELKMDVD